MCKRVSALDSKSLHHLAATEASNIFVCHVRKSTEGVVARQNCHPFRLGNWLFAHNGSVAREPLLQELMEHHRLPLEGETDSEVYFHWILQNIEECRGDLVEGIRSSLRIVRDYNALNFILSNGEYLCAYRDASKRHDYYSLYYLQRDPALSKPETMRSKELGALISSKSLRGERAVLICSERLTEEAWNEIPLGYLLMVSSKLEPRLVEAR